MRCPEVRQELATPTLGRDPAEVAGHLAACPPCSDWASRSERLNHLWDATRPDEPSSADFDAIWSGVCQDLDRPPAVADPARVRRRRLLVACTFAQAAALLVASLLLFPRPHRPVAGPDPVAQIPQVVPPPQIAHIEIDAGAGQLVMIRASDLVIVPRPQVGGTDMVAVDLEMLNHLEAIAQ